MALVSSNFSLEPYDGSRSQKSYTNFRRMLSMVYFLLQNNKKCLNITAHFEKSRSKIRKSPTKSWRDWSGYLMYNLGEIHVHIIQYIRTFIYIQKAVVEQVTVRLFVSSMELFKCNMQNKTIHCSYHGNSLTKRESRIERDGNGDRERERKDECKEM